MSLTKDIYKAMRERVPGTPIRGKAIHPVTNPDPDLHPAMRMLHVGWAYQVDIAYDVYCSEGREPEAYHGFAVINVWRHEVLGEQLVSFTDWAPGDKPYTPDEDDEDFDDSAWPPQRRLDGTEVDRTTGEWQAQWRYLEVELAEALAQDAYTALPSRRRKKALKKVRDRRNAIETDNAEQYPDYFLAVWASRHHENSRRYRSDHPAGERCWYHFCPSYGDQYENVVSPSH